MSALTDEERTQLKVLLQARIRETHSDIATLLEAVKPISPDNAIGRISRMDAIASKGVNEELLRQARQRLRLLERALERADTSAFGSCTLCGGKIPYGRMMIMPESTRCAQCAA